MPKIRYRLVAEIDGETVFRDTYTDAADVRLAVALAEDAVTEELMRRDLEDM